MGLFVDKNSLKNGEIRSRRISIYIDFEQQHPQTEQDQKLEGETRWN